MKQSGCDISLQDQCSHIAATAAQSTSITRKDKDGEKISHSEGFFAQLMTCGNRKIAMASDGIGTKVEIAERVGKYDTLGFDLMAMLIDDLICIGAEPISMQNILDVDYLDEKIVEELLLGLKNAAMKSKVYISGGEIAELGSRIHGFGNKMHFNWCGTALGVVRENISLPDGSQIEEEDIIIGLKSVGLRSNGCSLARKVLQEAYGENWHQEVYESKLTWGETLLTPCILYTPFWNHVFDQHISPKAICHITGGGIPGNFNRVFKNNPYGAHLSSLIEAPSFFKKLQQLGDISENKAYEIWNMGIGMISVISSRDLEPLLKIAREEGIDIQVMGKVIPERKLILETKGAAPQTFEYSWQNL